MRVVHIISGLGTGGAETMLYRLVSELGAHTNVVVSLTSIGPIGGKLLEEGIEVHAMNMRGVLGAFSLIRLWRLLRKVKPDIIQTWMYHADLIGSVIAIMSGNKNIVWNIRNTKIPQGRCSPTGVIILMCARLSGFVPKKIICCAQSALQMHAHLGYSREKLCAIPNGYDINNFEFSEAGKINARSSLKIPGDRVVIGMIGRFDHLKGYDVFIKAAGLLAKDHSNKYLFIAAGRGVDKNNKQLRQMISDFAPNATFKFLGERNDVPNVMQSLDVFCLASRAEGFPNVVAEAMLMQVPCVATDVGDASKIVGSSGVVVPPENPLALAQAISSIVSMDQAARLELGNSARRRIKDNYSIKSIAHQYENLYQSLGDV